MDSKALTTLLSGKKYLLLQGPMGPFFSELAKWLESLEREAVNVVFNGGDKLYSRHRDYRVFQQTPKEFPTWLKDTWQEYDFDTIVCFGDCRPLHQAAKRWAQAKGIRFLAFEEGYLRPHYITLEQNGVNAYSSLPRDAEFYRRLPPLTMPEIEQLKPSGLLRVRHAITYYLAGWHARKEFTHYRHHKSFSPWYEARCWVRAAWRKKVYAIRQRKVLPLLKSSLDQRYYLAILQVYNDSQIRNHSPYKDVRDYVNDVMHSFAKKAPPTEFLVFKHHPMDRGHRLYGPLIRQLGKKYGVANRVMYVHDLPMPDLLTHAKAVVTINSTAGISALIHNKPLKVMGNALYDIKGITYQGHLNQFWCADFKPDMKLFKQFRLYLLSNTQINAVYYGCHGGSKAAIADDKYQPVFISQKLMMKYINQQIS
ncbi:capsular biosynthesis protein [Rouxiella sp. T17]|uniref:capsule biosynthesis protein n=1 Tax=Rouxiella sp. T17 TaxID=3085684 RepID=UPI002FC7ADB2